MLERKEWRPNGKRDKEKEREVIFDLFIYISTEWFLLF